MALKQINKAESNKANQFSHYFLRNRDGGAVQWRHHIYVSRERLGVTSRKHSVTVQHGRQRVSMAIPTSRRDDSTANRHVSRERMVDPVHPERRWSHAAAPGPPPAVWPPPPEAPRCVLILVHRRPRGPVPGNVFAGAPSPGVTRFNIHIALIDGAHGHGPHRVADGTGRAEHRGCGVTDAPHRQVIHRGKHHGSRVT